MQTHQPQISPPHSPPSSNEDDELTWLNFLRTAGGNVHDVSFEAHRRRGFTSPSYLQQLYEQDSIPIAEGIPRIRDSQQLTQHHRPSPAAMLSSSLRASAGSIQDPAIALPQWQPDSDVSKCPVCDVEFTFWYRKHHCRKCGRVVCSACSPHRITIPRQYVIHPPNTISGDLDDDDLPSFQAGQLGGGEVVRVCNPCVPDPWTPAATLGSEGGQQQNIERPVNRPGDDNVRVMGARPAEGAQYSSNQPSQSQQRFGRYRSETLFVSPTRPRDTTHRPQLPPSRLSQSVPRNGQSTPIYRAPIPNPYPGASNPPAPRGHRYTASTHAHLGRPREGSSSHHDLIPYRETTPLELNRPPRRRVREEDECPVCGVELPTGEDVRVAHVEACIATRFTSPQPTVVATSTSSPDLTPSPLRDRRRGSSFRSRGMAVYRATEKDCVDDAGEVQECVICFEDFQPGDEMGRMECLCRFHRACIRRWWETKGPGSCPTHQLQE